MTPAKLLAKLAGKSLSFDDVPGGGRPEFDVAAGGLALAGLEPKYMAAIMYRWGGDTTQIKVLKKELMREAIKISRRERWPATRKGRTYLLDLIAIAIMEESPTRCHSFAKMMLLDPETTKIQRELIRQRKLLPVMMGCNVLEWRLFYSRKYEYLHGLLNNWCSVAHESMREKMKNPDEES